MTEKGCSDIQNVSILKDNVNITYYRSVVVTGPAKVYSTLCIQKKLK